MVCKTYAEVNKTRISPTILAIYVDDITLTGNNKQEIQDMKTHLNNVFSIKDLGKLHFFLGMEVHYLQDGIVLSTQIYKGFTKRL